MPKSHLPSIEALTSSDDDRLIAELRICEVRDQVAVARALLDEVDRIVPVSADGRVPPPGQVAEELARLGCKIVEIASALTRGDERAPVGRSELGASA